MRLCGTVPLTVDLVSFPFGVRQDFRIGGNSVDGLSLSKAGPLQLNAMGAVKDAIQNRVSDRGIAEHFGMPQRLTGESLRCGWLTRTIPYTASAFRSATDARDGDRG